jgi:hypothetical protein
MSVLYCVNLEQLYLSSTTHIFFHISHRWGFMSATLAASLGAAQNLYCIAFSLHLQSFTST